MTRELFVGDDGLLYPTKNSKITVVRELLPEAFTQSTIRPYNAILHSNAGPTPTRWQNLVAYLKRADIVIEPHFQVPMGEVTLVQTMPVNRRADCNYKANQWFAGGESRGAVSFETGDKGSPTLPTTPWDLGQLHVITHALAAIAVKYGIPATLTGAWNARGIGYHSQFPEWSVYVGKTCPGAQRIAQLPWVIQRVGELACGK